ncbi:NAD(P)/FAD-dependent oxidoreductase [Planosporangium sp. 12N6]|uniref:NAD(P)/FAD-dependent oxidoreductase n=1 Tax=Planosporangium spinosum TaxID=3402278 RepID=UPI003CFA5799
MTADPRTVVVVGAGMAGGRTCAALRAAGFTGEIVLVGAESRPPYDRPPLTKAALREEIDTTFDLDFPALNVKVRLGERAVGLDRTNRTLTTDAGTVVYDVLVVATGADPVRLPGTGRQVCFRGPDDAAELRAALVPGAAVVLIGAGWIGAEVATAALAKGCSVVCLESAEAPLASQLGASVGRRFLPWWREVDLRLGVQVVEVADGAVRLADASTVAADVVVTGVGARPALGWLADSGLEIDGGIAVDADRRTSDPNVYAVGDVAARWSARYGARVHSGHWDEAANGPAAVAAAIMGAPKAADDVPYFWSDQFGRKVQYVGQHRAADRVILREDEDPEKWAVAWVAPDGRLTAHLSVGFPRSMVQARAAIQDGRTIDAEAIRSLRTAL